MFRIQAGQFGLCRGKCRFGGIARFAGTRALLFKCSDLCRGFIRQSLRGVPLCLRSFQRLLQLSFIANFGALGDQSFELGRQPVPPHFSRFDSSVGNPDLGLYPCFLRHCLGQFDLRFIGGAFRLFRGALKARTFIFQRVQLRGQPLAVCFQSFQRLHGVPGQLVLAGIVGLDALRLRLQIEQARFQIVALVGKREQPVTGFACFLTRFLDLGAQHAQRLCAFILRRDRGLLLVLGGIHLRFRSFGLGLGRIGRCRCFLPAREDQAAFDHGDLVA